MKHKKIKKRKKEKRETKPLEGQIASLRISMKFLLMDPRALLSTPRTNNCPLKVKKWKSTIVYGKFKGIKNKTDRHQSQIWFYHVSGLDQYGPDPTQIFRAVNLDPDWTWKNIKPKILTDKRNFQVGPFGHSGRWLPIVILRLEQWFSGLHQHDTYDISHGSGR